jgi:hypothetical protein
MGHIYISEGVDPVNMTEREFVAERAKICKVAKSRRQARPALIGLENPVLYELLRDLRQKGGISRRIGNVRSRLGLYIFCVLLV